MTDYLAIDFGTSNTVLAVWNEDLEAGISFHLDEYGQYTTQDSEKISIIPSLIHYSSDGSRWIGN